MASRQSLLTPPSLTYRSPLGSDRLSKSNQVEDSGATNVETLAYNAEEAKRVSVLVQTDSLLDNPKFEPLHTGLESVFIGGKIGAIIGVPTSIIMLLGNSLKQRGKSKWLPAHLTQAYGQEFLENALNKSSLGKQALPAALSKVLFGIGISSAIGGLFFGPFVGSIMTVNARSKLLNIKRSAKTEFSDHTPDFIDRHINHVHKIDDPIAEYNSVRQELTNPKDAAFNGFHTAIFVKLLTLGSKIAAAAVLGGLFELARYGVNFHELQSFKKANSSDQHLFDFKSQKGLDEMNLSLDDDLKMGYDDDRVKFIKILEKREPFNETATHYLSSQGAEKYAEALINALNDENIVEYVALKMKASPVVKLLGETAIHAINPMMIMNLTLTPAIVAVGLIRYFTNEVGMEAYSPNRPDGTRWKNLLHGIRVVANTQKESLQERFHHSNTKHKATS